MLKVIRNVEVYSPDYLGIKTVVIVGDKIEGIYDKLEVPEDFISIEVIEGKELLLVPGFIDNHVHIVGGGGEGGFATRTPEIQLSDLTTAGITTVIGCLGTDNVCRNLTSLYAKACGLESEGLTTRIYTGSYEIPVKPLTSSIKEDMMLIDKVIGVGEIALSDHRSSQPTYEEFIRTVALARVGGMLSGKSGVVNIHLGTGRKKFEYLFRLMEEAEIPISQVLPTHCNREGRVFREAVKFAKLGGNIDLSTSFNPEDMEPEEVRASEAFKKLIENGVLEDNITFSSDGNGSMPTFNEKNEIVGLGICSVASLFQEVRAAVLEHNIPLDKVLKTVTTNPSRIFKLEQKGEIAAGKDADIVLLHKEDLSINQVIAKGKIHVKEGKAVIKGTYEK